MAASADRVLETTATAGTGPITLLGPKQGLGDGGQRSFNAAFGVGTSFYYSIVDTMGSAWEIGEGVLTDQFTMTRTRVISSSNANALVSFSSAGKDVFSIMPDSQARIETTWANRTAAVGANPSIGTEIIVTDVPTGGRSRWYWDGTYFRTFAPIFLHNNVTQVVGTATNTNQLLGVTPGIPRSVLEALRYHSVSWLATKSGTIDIVTTNLYCGVLGTSADAQIVGTAAFAAANRQFSRGELRDYSSATQRTRLLTAVGNAGVELAAVTATAYPTQLSSVLADVSVFYSIYLNPPVTPTDVPAVERFTLIGY